MRRTDRCGRSAAQQRRTTQRSARRPGHGHRGDDGHAGAGAGRSAARDGGAGAGTGVGADRDTGRGGTPSRRLPRSVRSAQRSTASGSSGSAPDPVPLPTAVATATGAAGAACALAVAAPGTSRTRSRTSTRTPTARPSGRRPAGGAGAVLIPGVSPALVRSSACRTGKPPARAQLSHTTLTRRATAPVLRQPPVGCVSVAPQLPEVFIRWADRAAFAAFAAAFVSCLKARTRARDSGPVMSATDR